MTDPATKREELRRERLKVMKSLEGKGVYVVSAPVLALLMEAFEHQRQFEQFDHPARLFSDKETKLVHRAFPKTKRTALARVRHSYAYEQTGRR